MLVVNQWTNLAGGNWSNLADWSNGVPNFNSYVEIAEYVGAQAYTVTISGLARANSVVESAHYTTLVDAGALYLASGGALEVFYRFELQQGGSVNGGTVYTSYGTFLWDGGSLDNVTVSGPLDLSAANSQLSVSNLIPSSQSGYNLPVYVTGAASVLTFLGAQTLADASVTLGHLTISPVTDAPASPPEILFQAPSAGSAILTIAATSSLYVVGYGEIAQTGSPLAGIFDYGSTTLSDDASLQVDARFVNYGALSLDSSGNATSLLLGSSGAPSGTLVNRGTMTLSDSAANLIDGDPGTGQGVFQNLGALSGAGAIGSGAGTLRFVNGGVVNVNGANALTLDTGAEDVNGGTFDVSGSGGLVVYDAVLNTGGRINVLDGSAVDLTGGSITGGALSIGANSLLETTAQGTSSGLLGVNVSNGGLIEADDDTTLTLDGGTLVTGVGAIEALFGSTLALGTTTISGGTLTTYAEGNLTTLSNASTKLVNATLSAGTELVQQDDDILYLSGTITLASSNGIAAEIQAGYEYASGPTAGNVWTTGVEVTGMTALEGGGVLQLGAPGQSAQIFAGAAATLINWDTIQGSGAIGYEISESTFQIPNSSNVATEGTLSQTPLTLINRGVIDAMDGSLFVSTAGTFNNGGGLVEATGGGALWLYNGVVGGAVEIGAGSTVTIYGVARTAISFDDSLGDTGQLAAISASVLQQSPISGFYADGLGASDSITLYDTAPLSGALTWSFKENGMGTAGTLTASGPNNVQLASFLLEGHYLGAGAIATSASSSLFSLSNGGDGVLTITTTALESTTPV